MPTKKTTKKSTKKTIQEEKKNKVSKSKPSRRRIEDDEDEDEDEYEEEEECRCGNSRNRSCSCRDDRSSNSKDSRWSEIKSLASKNSKFSTSEIQDAWEAIWNAACELSNENLETNKETVVYIGDTIGLGIKSSDESKKARVIVGVDGNKIQEMSRRYKVITSMNPADPLLNDR